MALDDGDVPMTAAPAPTPGPGSATASATGAVSAAAGQRAAGGAAVPLAAGSQATSLRVKQYYCPIVYGSVAWFLGTKVEGSQHTHKWTLFVRGHEGLDISYCVSKVQFTLHSSFAVPVRDVVAPPFEVSETGWGEFEVQMKLFFHDPSMAPITLAHFLKLYPPAGTPSTVDVPVISDKYDEVLFTDPQAEFEARLQAQAPVTPATGPSVIEGVGSKFDQSADLETITRVQKWVDSQLQVLRERLASAEAQAAGYKEDITALGGIVDAT